MGAEVTRVGIKRQVDKLGRIVIPKEYREFYHLDHNDEVFIVDTTEGLLITNYNYKVVKVDNKKSAQWFVLVFLLFLLRTNVIV